MATPQYKTNKSRNRLQSLKFKLILVSTALILLSVFSLALIFIQRQVTEIKNQLMHRGETITRLMAYNARYGVQIGDRPILDKIIGGIKDDPDVIYCIISEKNGKIITSHNQDRAVLEKIKPAFSVTEMKTIEYRGFKEAVINMAMPVELAAAPETKTESDDLEKDFFDSEMEMEELTEPAPALKTNINGSGSGTAKRVIGVVQVGISLENMKKDVATSIRQTVFYSLLIILVGFGLAFWLGSVITAPIRKVVSILNHISEGEGDLSQRIHLKSKDEVGDLAEGFNSFMDKFQEIKKISIFLNELADGGGDLTKRLNVASQDEVGMLAKGFDRFTDKLHDIICQVAENTEKIARASQGVSDTTVTLARELNEVAQQAGEVAQSSDQISRNIGETSENVINVNELINKTELVSNSGVDIVAETRSGMGQITETIQQSSEAVTKLNVSSQKIGNTITAITEIADQTKLIAINAAIEASRVGAQGKGFTVVAEEIRRLAARVTKATQDISDKIAAIQDESFQVVSAMERGIVEAENGMKLSNKSEKSLEDISQAVGDAKSRINQIAGSSSEQTSSINVISKNISSISNSARQCSDGVTSNAKSMQDLNTEVQSLRQLVGRFVLDC